MLVFTPLEPGRTSGGAVSNHWGDTHALSHHHETVIGDNSFAVSRRDRPSPGSVPSQMALLCDAAARTGVLRLPGRGSTFQPTSVVLPGRCSRQGNSAALWQRPARANRPQQPASSSTGRGSFRSGPTGRDGTRDAPPRYQRVAWTACASEGRLGFEYLAANAARPHRSTVPGNQGDSACDHRFSVP